MYVITGSINVYLKAPMFLGPNDTLRFEQWMRTRGWSISDNLHLDPMSEDYSVRHVEPLGIVERWHEDSSIWETRENIPHHLMAFYRDLGVVQNEQARPLYDSCPSCNICWSGLDDRKPTDANITWSHISLPWVGQKYPELRIMVLGINPYEGGGLDFFPQLIPQAQEELKQHKRVNFGHSGYRGSLLWHRIGLYVADLVDAYDSQDIDLDPQDAFPYLTFCNHIKCSPTGDRSVPSEAMWGQCHALLKQELGILRPNIIIVVGRGDNWHYLVHNVLDSERELLGETDRVRMASGLIGNQQVGLINVPHPSAPNGGASYQVEHDLRKLLYAHRMQLSHTLQSHLWFLR